MPLARRSRRAFTLLELLLVMALLGVLLGTGVGVLASLNLGERAALGLVQNVVRAARNSALARGGSARVRIDPNTGQIEAEALEVIGTWHFEDTAETLRGAFDIDGTSHGCVLVDDGFLGKALHFPRGRSVYADVPVHLDPSFDLDQGFRIECAVRLDESGGGRVLRLGQTAGIDVTDSGAIKAWFYPQAKDSTGHDVKGGRIVCPAPSGTLPVGTWKRLAVEYDRRRFTLSVDGVPIEPEDGWIEETLPVWPLDGAMVLGETQSSFAGSLDCLTISAVAASDAIRLPEGVRFDPSTPAVIRFDAGGNLDRETHREPTQIGLVYEDGRTAKVLVGMYGTVD